MKTLIAVILVFSSLNVFSQCISGFGIKGGVTFSKFDYTFQQNFTFKNKSITGFSAGLFAEFLNNKHLNIVAEGGYEQRGNADEIIRTDEFGNETGTYDFITRTHYITAGILARLIYQSKSITPYLLLGPKADFYLGYNSKYSDESGIPENEEITNSAAEQFKKVNYSINLGAGLQFEKLLPLKTFIEFNYSPALNTSYNGYFVKIKENYFNLKIGVNFIKKFVTPKRK